MTHVAVKIGQPVLICRCAGKTYRGVAADLDRCRLARAESRDHGVPVEEWKEPEELKQRAIDGVHAASS